MKYRVPNLLAMVPKWNGIRLSFLDNARMYRTSHIIVQFLLGIYLSKRWSSNPQRTIFTSPLARWILYFSVRLGEYCTSPKGDFGLKRLYCTTMVFINHNGNTTIYRLSYHRKVIDVDINTHFHWHFLTFCSAEIKCLFCIYLATINRFIMVNSSKLKLQCLRSRSKSR